MQSIKISHQIPPVYTLLYEKFRVEWSKGLIIAYGDTIYSKNDISPAKMAHEATHLREQTKIGVEKWWSKYLEDPTFRLEEEILAYANEASFVKANIKDRNLRYRMTYDMAAQLSSEMYGNLISLTDALKLIS